MTQEPASAPDGPAPPGNSPASDGSPRLPPPSVRRPSARRPTRRSHPASGYPTPANVVAAIGLPADPRARMRRPDRPARDIPPARTPRADIRRLATPAPGYPPPGYAARHTRRRLPRAGYPGPSYGGGYQPTTPGQIPVPRLPGINRLQPVGGTPFAYAYVRVPAGHIRSRDRLVDRRHRVDRGRARHGLSRPEWRVRWLGSPGRGRVRDPVDPARRGCALPSAGRPPG